MICHIIFLISCADVKTRNSDCVLTNSCFYFRLHHKFEKDFITLNNLDNSRLSLHPHSRAEPLRKHIAHVTLAGL